MRGPSLLGEPLLSHYVCPSCNWRIASRNAVNGSRLRRSKDSSNHLRPFSSSPRNPLLPRRYPRPPTWNNVTTRSIQTQVLRETVYDNPFSVEPWDLKEEDLQRYNEATQSYNDRLQQERQDHIDEILRNGQPSQVMAAFLDPENHQIIGELTPAVFAAALSLLSPAHFIEPYKEIQRQLDYDAAKKAHIEPLEEIFARFVRNLKSIVNVRRDAGYSLGLAEYTHLLDCARSMANGEMATIAWVEMAEDNISPTAECFNYYMEALIWDGAYLARENFRLRSLPWLYTKRTHSVPAPRYRGFRTGPDGAHGKVHGLFNEMSKDGINPNESTFIHVMTASSREWDVDAVKKILKAVWNINVNALQREQENLPEVTKYPASSPLHPTDNLLFAVAHIFCTNNDLPTALQLVDFISVNYGLQPSERVWMELFTWSFVLSLKRGGKSKEAEMVGHVDHTTVSQMFTTLTSEPYNIKPNMHTYNILVKYYWHRQVRLNTFRVMRQGRKLFLKTLTQRNLVFKQLRRAWKDVHWKPPVMSSLAENHDQHQPGPKNPDNGLGRSLGEMSGDLDYTSALDSGYASWDALGGTGEDFHTSPNQYQETTISNPDPSEPGSQFPSQPENMSIFVPTAASPKDYWHLYSRFERYQMAAQREFQYIRSWATFLLLRRRWKDSKYEWERREVPHVIEEWLPFFSRKIHYHTTSGIVEFDHSFRSGTRPFEYTLNSHRERSYRGPNVRESVNDR